VKPITCRDTWRYGLSTWLLWLDNIIFVLFVLKDFCKLTLFLMRNYLREETRDELVYINAKLLSWVTCQGVYNTLRHSHIEWSYSANGQHLFQRVSLLLALQYSTGFTNAAVGKVLQMSIVSLPLLILHYEWNMIAFQQAKYTGVTNIKITVNYLRFRFRFLRKCSTKHNTSHTTAAMTLHQGCQAIGHSQWNSTRLQIPESWGLSHHP